MKKLNLILIIAITLGFITATVSAMDLTLAWDENSETDLDGYRIFCRLEGQEYNYSSPDWEGTEASCTLNDLDSNAVYYFVARAYDQDSNESGNSNEVKYDPETGNISPVTDDDTNSDDEEEDSIGGCFLKTVISGQ